MNSLGGLAWEECLLQDSYNVPTLLHAENKRSKIRNHFLEIANTISKDKVCINFCSGVSNFGFCFPHHVALRTNPEVLNHRGHLGIVVLDFPSRIVI